MLPLPLKAVLRIVMLPQPLKALLPLLTCATAAASAGAALGTLQRCAQLTSLNLGSCAGLSSLSTLRGLTSLLQLNSAWSNGAAGVHSCGILRCLEWRWGVVSYG